VERNSKSLACAIAVPGFIFLRIKQLRLNRSGIAMSETILGPNHMLQTFFKIVAFFVNFRLNRLSGDQENFLFQKTYNSDVRGTKNA
jgi:hypothetical protein